MKSEIEKTIDEILEEQGFVEQILEEASRCNLREEVTIFAETDIRVNKTNRIKAYQTALNEWIK